MSSREIFDRIANASSGGGGEPLRDGSYDMTVLSVCFDKKFSGECFLAKHLINEAAPAFDDIEPQRPGTEWTYVVNLDGKGKQSAPGNIKDYVLALMGKRDATPDQIKAFLAAVCDPKQPARGYRVKNTTYRKFTKTGECARPNVDAKGRAKFVAHGWSHVEESDEVVAKRRKDLDSV